MRPAEAEAGKLPAEYTVTLDDDVLVHKFVERATGIKSMPFPSVTELVKRAPDLKPIGVFVDLHLSNDESGLEVIPKLRELWPFCPIIIVTGDPTEAAVSEALACGADDFVTKPIRPKELLARLQTRLMDQALKEARQIVQIGPLSLDTHHRMLTGPKGNRFLSTTETNLLLCLLQAKGTIVDRGTLKSRCWGPLKVSEGALDRKIYELRRALEETGANAHIRTTYGVGFGLDIEGVSYNA